MRSHAVAVPIPAASGQGSPSPRPLVCSSWKTRLISIETGPPWGLVTPTTETAAYLWFGGQSFATLGAAFEQGFVQSGEPLASGLRQTSSPLSRVARTT